MAIQVWNPLYRIGPGKSSAELAAPSSVEGVKMRKKRKKRKKVKMRKKRKVFKARTVLVDTLCLFAPLYQRMH